MVLKRAWQATKSVRLSEGGSLQTGQTRSTPAPFGPKCDALQAVHRKRQAAQRNLQPLGEEVYEEVVGEGGEEDLVEVGLNLWNGGVGGEGVDDDDDLCVVRPELGDQEPVVPIVKGAAVEGGTGKWWPMLLAARLRSSMRSRMRCSHRTNARAIAAPLTAWMSTIWADKPRALRSAMLQARMSRAGA